MIQLISDTTNDDSQRMINYNLEKSSVGFTVGGGKRIKANFATQLKGLSNAVLPDDHGYPIRVVQEVENARNPIIIIIIGIDVLRYNKVAIDYDTGCMCYKSDPHTVCKLERIKGLFLHTDLSKSL